MQVLSNHLQSISETVDFPYMLQWLDDSRDIPIVVAVLYLTMVMWIPKNYMANRKPYKLRMLNTLWNLLLSTFSFVGAYYCLPRLVEILFAEQISGLELDTLRFISNMTPAMRRNIIVPDNFVEGKTPVGIRGGWDASVCVWKEDIYRRGVTGLLTLAFTLSKLPEMLDTAFLVFQKKEFNFLHWYHHVTVMLYCWHAFISPTSSGLWFATMNFCVHTSMYFYYFVFSIGYGKYIRPLAPLITFAQIAQMIVGSVICVYVYSMYAFGGGCDCSPSNARLGLAMYASYLYLFCEYYVNRYWRKTGFKAVADKRAERQLHAAVEQKKNA